MRPAASVQLLGAAAQRRSTRALQQQQQQYVRAQSTASSSSPSSTSTATFVPFSPLPSSRDAPKPPLDTWYTGRPALAAFLDNLQSTVQRTRSTLFRAGYLSSIQADPTSTSSPSPPPRWISADEMATRLNLGKIRLGYYRKITTLLSEINSLKPLLAKLDSDGLSISSSFASLSSSSSSSSTAPDVDQLESLVAQFRKLDARLSSGSIDTSSAASAGSGVAVAQSMQRVSQNKQRGYLDPTTQIAYGLGRKKESTARAWVIPLPHALAARAQEAGSDSAMAVTGPSDVFQAIQQLSDPSAANSKERKASTASAPSIQTKASKKTSKSDAAAHYSAAENDDDPYHIEMGDLAGMGAGLSSSLSQGSLSALLDSLKIGSLRVNNLALSEFFPAESERSVILRPFKLTDTLGIYNVFVLVEGGGYSSQAAAAAVACARALAATDVLGHPERRAILSKADLLRRDPRVVERKKTGRPKARKRYTWVKR